MLGYVGREIFKKCNEIPDHLIGSETGKKYKLIFMRYPSKMICSSCATAYLKNKDSIESMIPYYLLHHEQTCKDCGIVVTP
jgi:hypothetical protein